MLAAGMLAVAGTVLAGLPLAAPLALTVPRMFAGRPVLVDYLMPGELFVFAVAGGICLLAAGLLGRRLRLSAGLGLASVAALFVLVGLVADATGLASGATRPEGAPLVLVAGTYVLYILAVIGLFVVGVLLCRRVFAVALRSH